MKYLSKLKNARIIQITDNEGYRDESGSASVIIFLSDGTKLRVNYWRIIKEKRHLISCFDHQQKYDLPAPINAKEELRKAFQGKKVISAQLDKETGDLILHLTGDLEFQILNFTGYEIWEIRFPDGSVEYSNHAK